jgi:hypothetical protein
MAKLSIILLINKVQLNISVLWLTYVMWVQYCGMNNLYFEVLFAVLHMAMN